MRTGWLLLVCACASESRTTTTLPVALPSSTPSAQPSSSTDATATPCSVPALVLAATSPQELSVTLQNCTDHDVAIVLDTRQHVTLEVTTGARVAAHRAVPTAPAPKPPRHFAPASATVIDTVMVVIPENGKNVVMLPSDRYLATDDVNAKSTTTWHVRAKLTSTITDDGAWVGTLTSNSIDLELP